MRPSPRAFRRSSVVAFFVVASLLINDASCQCTTQWVPREGLSGVNSFVRATRVWDPDGAGPLPPVLVVGGRFAVGGAPITHHIAAYEPVAGTWSSLGGMNDVVYALAILPNGDLVAGGAFTTASGVSANRVARWNGSAWQPLGAGTDADVFALTVLPNGDVIAGGAFTTAGGVVTNRIARWGGVAWSPVGSGMDAPVRALTTMANGNIVAGGTFTMAGGSTARRIARWDGAAWSSMGSGASPSADGVYSLITLANGDVIAGGSFITMGSASANNVARWTNGAWLPIGVGVPGATVHAVGLLSNGDLFARGFRWNGSTWSMLGSSSLPPFFSPVTHSVAVLPNGDLVAGGVLSNYGIPQLHLARWSGTIWSPLGADFDGPVRAMVTMPNGDVVVGGSFTVVPGAYAFDIARWNGVTWSSLVGGPGGWSSVPSNVNPLTTLPNGDLLVCGQFGGASVPEFGRWNGTNWVPLGPGMTLSYLGGVSDLVILPNGDWIVAGSFTSIGGVPANNIARWNGAAWSPLGTGTNNRVNSIVVMGNGDVVAGGHFTTAGGVTANRIARWDGVSWSALGSGLTAGTTTPGVYDLLLLPGGDLVVAGDFTLAGGTPANHVARWRGGNWRPLGAGMDGAVTKLATLPNGDVIAGGYFTLAGGFVARRLARWNGAAWAPLRPGTNGPVLALHGLANGDLLASGQFAAAGVDGGAYLARLTTTCPASAVPLGNGCAGSGGPNVLSATSLPWIGSTFRSVATGMPAPALALGVVGFSTTSIPMPSILPQGVPGCTLLVSPDLLDVYVPAAGIVQTQLAIPNTVALAGVVLHQQVVPLEFSGTGDITALTGTNALTLTIGSF